MSFEPWDYRCRDIADSLNPAHLGLLSHSIVKGYNRERGCMPLVLFFPAVAMVLHPMIREAMPRTVSAKLAKWLCANPDLRAELLMATRLFDPQIKEGLLAALKSNWIIPEDGCLRSAGTRPSLRNTDEKLEAALKTAVRVGRWLGTSGNQNEIYQDMGLSFVIAS